VILIISDIIQDTEIKIFDWLKSKGKKCKILSSIDFVKRFELNFQNINSLFSIKTENFNEDIEKTIWIRRDRFSVNRYLANSHHNEVISLLKEEGNIIR